jgi:hypothetical protein
MVALARSIGVILHRMWVEGTDFRSTKVVTRVVSTRIGNIIEGGEKNVHWGTGSKRAIAALESVYTLTARPLRSAQVPNAIRLGPCPRENRPTEGRLKFQITRWSVSEESTMGRHARHLEE